MAREGERGRRRGVVDAVRRALLKVVVIGEAGALRGGSGGTAEVEGRAAGEKVKHGQGV